MSRRREAPVEIVGSADQCKMSERLWKAAEVLAARAELLPVQPEVTRVSEHLLEEEPCFVEVA
jgi:hypothetical protein